jgi:outer membrane protein assembly factor BamB
MSAPRSRAQDEGIMRNRWTAFTFLVLAIASPAHADPPERGVADFPKLAAETDWPWWRGPARNGVAAAGAPPPPVRWGETENVVWRASVPGRGHSSPIVVGDRVILTTADEATQVQSVVAFDRRDGRQLWKTDVSRDGFPARIHPKNTHATPTIACDGERLVALFFNHKSIQATALGLDGKQRWQTKVGDFDYKRYQYGYAASPVLYRGTFVVAAESEEQSFLAALDRATGKPIWRAPRPANTSYSSPSIAHVAGRDQLFLSGDNKVCSYDPATGKELWSAPGTTDATCGTIVWDGDVVIASGGYPKAQTLAIRADGSGTVLWRNGQQCYEQSLLAHQGHVYSLTNTATLFCWRVSDGAEMWKRKLRGPVSASPVLAGGHIYWANEKGTTYVFKPNPEKLELVAENVLGDESMASPAVAGGQLFLRVARRGGGGREETLYCVGAKK